MARPKKNSVADAAKLADELIAAQAAEREKGSEPAPEDDDEVTLEIPEDEPPQPPDIDTSDGFDMSSLDEPEPPPAPPDKDLAHKLSVLQGKYNAETERLSTLLSSTMTEVQSLKAQLLKKTPAAPELADLSDDDADIDSLKTQFPALYKSFMALARSEAKREVTMATKGTAEKVDAIVQKGEVDTKNAYYSRLTESLPSWEQINNHPSFLKWLNEPDEFSGTTRRNLLGAAYNRNDHTTTLKFFNAFIKEKGIRVKGKVTDDSDGLAPDTSGASVNRSNRSSGPEITRAQMQKFYQDKAMGKLDMSQADIEKMEARFFQAAREGKIKP
jgi:hypothetical protein